MIEVVPFRAEHLEALRVQPAQRPEFERLSAEGRRRVAAASDAAVTVRSPERVLACWGTLPFWPGRALTWAYLAADPGPAMVAVHRAARAFVAATAHRRLEAWVRCDFAAAHRWMRLLGFRCEAERMVGFFPGGADVALYARVRPEL